MVTWTFDLLALIVGIIVGGLLGGIIMACWIFEDGQCLKEWKEGYKAGAEAMKEVYQRAREEDDAE